MKRQGLGTDLFEDQVFAHRPDAAEFGFLLASFIIGALLPIEERMRPAAWSLTALSFMFVSLGSPAQNSTPDIGQWVAGPAGSAKDIGQDATSSGQLAVGNAVLTNSARMLLGCKGGGPQPTVELRAIVPQLRGFVPASISPAASLSVDDNTVPVQLGIYPLNQNATIFVVTPSSGQVKQIASLGMNKRANVYLRFHMAGRDGFFITTVDQPQGAVASVLTSCGVAIPKAEPIASRATAATKRYDFMGLYLGMTKTEATAAEKAIATTSIKPSVSGGVEFATKQFDFDVDLDDSGLVSLYKVCGKPSRQYHSGPHSGPLYEAVVKAFGPPDGKTTVPDASQWDKSGGVDANYSVAPEVPDGCLLVTNVQ